ncbi:MAG: hypothetical protein V7641_5282 [Blastocatellia bacterium]
MNRDLEEQKIRQWFREARQRDEARAPSFAESLAAARSKTLRARPRWLVWRIALVSVALIAIGGAAFVFVKQSTTSPLNQAAAALNLERSPDDQPPPVAVNRPIPSVVPPPAPKAPLANSTPSPRRPRVAQPQGHVEQAALLSLKWQSPTDFLLRTPGADLLKTVPRLGDSLIRFAVIHSDEKN